MWGTFLFVVVVALSSLCAQHRAASPQNEVRLYRDGLERWYTERILAALDAHIDARAICERRGTQTYLGLSAEQLEQRQALELALATLRARGWNATLRNVTLWGAPVAGQCVVPSRLGPQVCARAVRFAVLSWLDWFDCWLGRPDQETVVVSM